MARSSSSAVRTMPIPSVIACFNSSSSAPNSGAGVGESDRTASSRPLDFAIGLGSGLPTRAACAWGAAAIPAHKGHAGRYGRCRRSERRP
jgi:hypothetical protein